MEEALVRRMQAGDEGAFDELFALYQKQAVRTAALITGDASLAEDVTQDVFVRLLTHTPELVPGKEKAFEITETICAAVAEELKQQGFSTTDSSFLQDHLADISQGEDFTYGYY